MPTLREEAEVLRLGLLTGLVPTEAAVAWADRVIAATAAPPVEVIDIAMASQQPADEMVRMLGRVPGAANLSLAAYRALGILRARFIGGGLPLEAAADMLGVYSAAADIPESERQVAANFIDEYHCLAYHGTSEGLRGEVERFLAEHAAGGWPGAIT